MTALSTLSRRLISCLLMMLILQGVVQASAEAMPQDHMQQHCADHDPGQDCACCADMAMAGGCATMCSANIAVSPATMIIPRIDADVHRRVAVKGAAGPAYLPLNPPPIS